MKTLVPYLLLVAFYAPIVFGDFDFTISDTYEYGTFILNNQSLLVTGAGADAIWARNSSYVEVQNTASPLQLGVAGIYTLDLDDTSIMNFSGGEMGNFLMYQNAEATFSGGFIGTISSHQDSDIKKHITFICDVDSVNYNTSTKLLTGDWLNDGGSFSITLVDQSSYASTYSNIQFIPEPATLGLLGIGGLLIRRKK